MSKSILENVIFCHQEESNWPLSEASVLKKKFDDIFDATRYTKALDNIKTIRKERAQDLKVAKAELDALKIDRDRSEALKDKKSKLIGLLTEKQTRLDELDEEIRRITKENKQFYDSAVKFREIVNQAETLEEKKRLHEQNRESLRMSMTESDEADEELQRRKDSFQDHLDKQRRRKNDMLRKIDNKKDELSQIEARYSRKLSERGALENDKKRHEEAIIRREQEIRQMSFDLGIRGFDVDGLSESHIEDFSNRLSDFTRKAEDNLKSWKEQSALREADISNRYQELRTEKSSKASSREAVAENSRRLKTRIKQAQDELDNVAVSEVDISEAREAHQEDLRKTGRLRKEIEDANYDEQIRKKNGEIRDLDDLREERTSELNTLNRHADFRAKLDMKKKDSEHKGKAADALVGRNAAAFKRLVGKDAILKSFDKDLSQASIAKDREVAAAEREEAEKNRGVQHLESMLSMSRSQLKEKKEQLTQLETEIKDFLDKEEDVDTIEHAVIHFEKQLEEASEGLSESSSLHALFKRILQHGNSQHTCIGCGRGIKEDELAAFERYVNHRIKQSSPEGKKELQEAVDDWKAVLAEARALLPKEERAKALKATEVPALNAKIDRETAELAAKSEEAEKATAALRALRDEQQELANLKRVASEISRLTSEAAVLSKEITSLENDLASTGTVQTGDEVQNAINDLADSIKRLKRELQTIERNRETKRNELTNAERASFRSELTVSEMEQKHSTRETLQKRIDELKAEFAEASGTLKELEDAIDGFNAPIKKTKEELEQLKSDNAQEESKLAATLQSMQAKTRTLQEADDRINNYISQRGAQKLADCVDKIADLQSQTQGIQQEVKEVEADVAKIDKDLNESKATERNIVDNLRYRQLGRDLKKIDEELSCLDLDEASVARMEFESKYHDQKQLENSLNGESQHLSGEIASLKDQIKQRDEELKTDYKDIHKRFSKKLVEVKTSEIANADLEKYAKALDAAIIRFHGLKMQEVNEQIRYLWAKTYQGTDIDSISIESDSEKVGNRTYNYRVCMMKDTVKMDMRGRCSAGQKVLASIIIRLALADSFATNCRFMALDEPTLCLDQETVEALARSLGDIIKERPNTQLLIVTHDPQFLNLLAQSTSIDHYWRVSRDASMKSIIERERIR